jgi:hypothetical protein
LTNIVGLKAEARYYYCPPKQFSWEPAKGIYNGLYGQVVKAEPFTNDDITYLAAKGQTFGLKTDLSFIQYCLGVTFFFGRGLRH